MFFINRLLVDADCSELINTLASLRVVPESGVAYRLIHAKYSGTALSSIGSLKFGGRYNLPQTFEAQTII